jgi:hypothetical protein
MQLAATCFFEFGLATTGAIHSIVLQSLKKKHANKLLVVMLAVLGLIGITLVFWQRPLDLSADEAPLNQILLPPQSVGGDIFMDGGSVWVRIVDRGGSAFDLAFPYDHAGTGTKYLTAFHGAGCSSDPGAVAFKNTERAKDVALLLLQRYSAGNDDGAARAYVYLSEPRFPAFPDFLRRIAGAFK